MSVDIFRHGVILRLRPEVTSEDWYEPATDFVGQLYGFAGTNPGRGRFCIRLSLLKTGVSTELSTSYPKETSLYDVYYIPCSSRSEAREAAREFGLSVIDNGDGSPDRWAAGHIVPEI